jgi:hypothetical protein
LTLKLSWLDVIDRHLDPLHRSALAARSAAAGVAFVVLALWRGDQPIRDGRSPRSDPSAAARRASRRGGAQFGL